ncbi:Ribosomal large subunit pseudouridine synthase D [[Eubacterium] contortum]|uniref:Pseudouridine synthase n=1 Tax=Faecalicatena contorta TaxID=39482 RepID=A0A174M000_9FIRM|nr:RluA family pseudouridine synthase [Faecalicatena contorta]MBS6766123.1 RluA family pseudouridine synthase [Clostridium sp.]CUP27508.1 Ribosomal large subunit pseudouridine synthase D [[Eubacterium] contortum] [Faecalicatena contorta]
MDRMLDYTVQINEDGLRVEQFLRRRGYSRQNLVELKKMPLSILVNGSPRRLNEILTDMDTLTVHIQEHVSSLQIPPVHLPLDIIYEDEDIIIINKPAGMPVHPSINNYTNTLANGLAWYYREQGKPFIFRCTNRLDRDTSGLTIIAKHMLSSNILSRMTVRHEIRREYLAIVRGSVQPAEGTISAPLSRKPGSVIERTVDFDHGERAVTHYHVVEEKNGHSLVSLLLETGRTHQIRIHMKYLGFPLIGDYLYNPDMEYMQRQALHSCCLALSHPITGEKLEFHAPLPEDMQRVFPLFHSGFSSCTPVV